MFFATLRSSTHGRSLRWAASFTICVLVLVFGRGSVAQNAGNPPSQTPQQPTSEGRQLFESICASCHGLDGRGGERGPDIATRPQIVQLSDSEIMEILRVGRPTAGMPPFQSFGEAKLRALLLHLRSLQGKGSAVAVPGNAHNGKLLFFGKARCSECHMVQGAGGFLGRDLSTYGTTLSPTEIRSNILQAGERANKANKTAVIIMRDSRKLTGVIRNEDNFSIQLQSFDGAFHFLNRFDVAQIEFLPQPIMPTDYATSLSASELDDIVSYLSTVARTGKTKNHSEGEEDDPLEN
jgi:cytochrome c oxidase cbb3-type subunit III